MADLQTIFNEYNITHLFEFFWHYINITSTFLVKYTYKE